MFNHMINPVTNRIATRVAAFGLAAVVTLSMLSGIDTLAVQEHAMAGLSSAQTAPSQQVAHAPVQRARG